MKNFSLCALAAGALLLAASCNKIESTPAPAPQDTQPCTVTFSVYDAATKATTTSDAKVNSLQVFVFLGDNLDVYGSSATSSVSLECTPGPATSSSSPTAPTSIRSRRRRPCSQRRP